MRFEPKIILPDEAPTTADGEIELPADLDALAGQLGDDARRLAECYPAAIPTHASSGDLAPSQADRRRQWRAALAATAVVLAGIAIAGGWWKGRAPAGRRSAAPTAAAVERSPVIAEATSSRSERLSVDGGGTRGRPTLSLTELSQPELEALLDLLDRDPRQPVSISF